MRTALAILAITAIGSVLANLVLRLGSLTEYKYVFTAGVCLVAPAIAGLERTVLLTQRGRVRMLVAAIAVLALVMVAYTRDQIPRNTSAPLAVRENSFWLRLAEREPEAGWTDAVRKKTPTSAVLVVNHPDFHTSAFTGRSLLVPTEKDRPHFGYSLNTESNMVRIRGYDSGLVKRRLQLLAALYRTPVADGDALLRELRSLGRPVVLVYRPGDARGFADWMRTRGIGQIVYEADPYLVYMVEP